MKNYMKIKVLVLMVSIMVFSANAKLSQPDFVLYGTATWFGQPLPNNSDITIYLDSQLLTVAKYSMGTDTNLNGLYALRVPMDDLDPRVHGKARPGDPASVFLNGNLVAELLVGAYGTAQRLDLDPLNLGSTNSILNVMPAELQEGNSGSNMMIIEIALSEISDTEVLVNWATNDDTAFGGGACGFDVDYISANGTATIPAQTLSATVNVEICGDTIIETSETFEIVLTQPVNAVIQFDRGIATILDDDGLPELRGFDQVVFEPVNASLIQEFQLSLSRAYEQEISFNFETIAGSASAGTDYVHTSGQITIPVGDQQVLIPVEFLADGETESIEVLQLQISNVVNAQLMTPVLTGFIMDSDREQQTEHQNEVDNITLPELISPSDVVISSDDKHVYVSSLSGEGSILHFAFDEGELNLVSTINSSVVGFETGMFKLIRQLAITPNGKYLYAAVSGDDAIMAFNIDVNTGELSLVGNLAETVSGEFGIKEVYGIVISSDNKHLYAVGSGSDSLAAFSIDDTTGTLTYIEAEVQGVNDPSDTGATVTFMDRPIKLSISPDGNNIYVAADFSSSVAVFDRDETSGTLSYKQSLKSGVSGVTGIGGASAVMNSADGSHVYALGRADDSVVVFNRDPSGLLSFNQALTKVTPDFIGLEGPNALVSNPIDNHVYALGFDDSSMVSFNRNNQSGNAEFGNLEFADLEQDGVAGIEKMNGPTALAITSDGAWIIVSAGIDNALVVFDTPLNDLIFKQGFE